jgi:hypothetical protein
MHEARSNVEESAILSLSRMIGFVALGVVAVAVGIKMLSLTWRTREFPEAAIGVHILVLMLGYSVEFAGIEGADRLGMFAELLRGVGNLCYVIAILVYLLFTWRVFRPTSRVAAVVAYASILGLIVGWSGEVFTSRFDFGADRFEAPWFWIAFIPRLVCMGWATGEALLEYRRARRRMRLGLSEPLVTNRFLLWGLAALSEFLIYVAVVSGILRGVPSDFLNGTTALIVSALGMSAAITILLAFLPPRAYRDWVAGRQR